MADFIVRELRLDALQETFDWHTYGVDEYLWGSLNAEDAIGAPGGFTRACLERGVETNATTRLTHWKADGAPCPTRWRHSMCVLGAEHLPELLDAPQLFANKFLPAFDFGAAVCWLEELFRRTHLDRGLHRLRPAVYLDLPQASAHISSFNLLLAAGPLQPRAPPVGRPLQRLSLRLFSLIAAGTRFNKHVQISHSIVKSGARRACL